MSENERVVTAPGGADTASSMTAGQLLRAAREQSGMQLAALAAAIKVTPQKLEALEADRLEALPDATFARALAKTVCRFLKVDPVPVLARLPDVRMSELEHVAQGLNQPFRDTAQRQDLFKVESLRRPVVLVSLLLVIAALVLWALPPGMLQSSGGEEPTTSAEPAPSGVPPMTSEPVPATPLPLEPAASAAVPAVPSPVPAVPPPVAAPAVPPAVPPAAVPAVPPAAVPAVPPTVPPASAPGAAAAGAVESLAAAVVLRTLAPSWVELRDAEGKTLLSRQLAGGETATLAGRFPMQLKIGNVSGTEVTVRGQPLDLRMHARNNVARLEIQ